MRGGGDGGGGSASRRRLCWWLAWAIVVLLSFLGFATPDAPPFPFAFTRHVYNTTISENSVGKTYVMPDEKMGIFISDPTLDVKYKINSGDNDKFFKADARLVGDFWFLLIRTRTGHANVLNRERQEVYHLQVRATVKSRGRQRVNLRAKTEVRVQVLDTNDLNPLFYPTDYDVVVPEDTPLHRSIAQVSASDADIGINGEVYYSFLEYVEQFAVHPTTGVVSLTRPLSFHERSVHKLTVVAQDRGTKHGRVISPSSRARLQVTVQQVNLHDPHIFVRHLPSVVEDSNVDIYAIVKVTDEDEGAHGQIARLEILSGDPNGHFRIQPGSQPNEYNIVVLSFLDRELAPDGYNLTLRATDRGTPQRNTTKVVRVRVTDLNDHAPEFTQKEYHVVLEEVSPVNTPVVRVRAHDTDAGRNAEVVYEIVEGNDDRTFGINSATGLVVTAKALDAEEQTSYRLTVMAMDQGNNGMRKSSSAQITVTVQDNNDQDPMFVKTSTEVVLDENEQANTLVFRATAVDSDQGENGYVSYSIANLSPTPFTIDHFTGEVRTKEVLDYETMRRNYLLKIRASDWGTPFRRQAEMTLRITLRDVNDNRPQFEKVDCAGVLFRKTPIRSEILTLSAIDFDSGNIITYRIVSGNEDRCFELDATSGVITLACSLEDVRTRERYLNVTATDGLNFADTMPIRITLVSSNRNLQGGTGYANFECREVGVTQQLKELMALSEKNNQHNSEVLPQMPTRFGVNKHSPEFDESFPARVEVNESVPVGSEIALLKAVDKDLGYNGQVVYVISHGNVDSCFQVDMSRGILKVVSPLDRERRSSYRLNVTAYDLGRQQRATSKIVQVDVLDVNDNPPVFIKASHSMTLPENSPVGTVVVNLTATDRDIGPNAVITYTVISDDKDFTVHPSSGVVTVRESLDRERQSVYELKIRATDGGGDRSLSSTAIVRIKILDVNDNPPTFSLQQYIVRVREDVPVGTVVLPLSARDPDLGEGGRISYSLEGGEDEQFLIDRDFGTIRLANPLDFESKQVYNVTVRARDRGNPSLRSRTYVIVEVMDVNENQHAPQFEDFVASGTIAENQAVGSFVMQVTATDGDDKWKNDGKVVYSIRDGDGMGRFFINQEGNIYTSEVLDRETSKRYWLTIFAQDRGAVPLHSHLHVYIEVQDENDNTPQTQEPVYYPSVAENSNPGTTVVKIEAYDLDQNPEQRLQYRISGGNPQGFFVIDSDTGVITTTSRRLDRENQDEHALEVTVSDNGRPPLSSTTRVVVTVTDINDHSPHFAEQLYRVRIPEMPRNDTDIPLFQVVAFDRDSGPNADIDYTIKAGKGNGRFKINAKSGMIYSQKNFSADLQYELQIQAEDNGRPRKSGKTRVILDVIERHPISSSPPVLQAIPQPIRVNENEVVGHLLTVVQAEDPDGDPLWYSIDDGNKNEVFMMNRETGEVVLVHPLDWETHNAYNLTISVTDGVHTVSTQLYITVVDYNDNRPEFSEKIYLVEISENIPVNTEIIQLQAWDRDEDKRVFFAIHSSTNPASMHKFHIDSSQGAIVTMEKLDREACHQHVLTVLVKDHGHPSHSNFARVVITVRDHNDYAPRFLTDVFTGHVHETTALGTSVLQVLSVDRDKGKNAEVQYSIVSGNIGGTFSIDRTLGTITVARELKMKSQPEYEYTLVVKAMDHGDPPLSSVVTVNIEVTMADNAAPKFGKEEYSTEIRENMEEGSYVIAVEAISKSTVYYEILSGNVANHFVINPNSGIIAINWPIDYETLTFFNLTIQATNMVNQFALTYVLVHILDVNDNAPYFLHETYTGTLSEAAAIGSIVMANNSAPLVISAKDDDSELNAVLVYEITDKTTQKYFTIDANTGAIRSISILDHEEIKQFEFQVQVSDMGKPRLCAEVAAHVVIHIEDVNDCTPVFDQEQYNVSVLLPTFKNVVVTTVKASDGDVDIPTVLKYDIVAGNVEEKFQIGADTGVITVKDDKNMQNRYVLAVRVSDGKFSSKAKVNIMVDKVIRSGLFFSQEKYFVNIMENNSAVTTVAVVTVLGNSLDEHLHFQILNPSTMFTVGATSGVIRTVGIPFDREVRDTYTLIVEARSELEQHRVAQVAVYVSVMDVNDNSPIFINMPYYSVVPVDAKEGDIILKVQAIDKDIGDNGEVRYELSEGDKEFFRVNSKSGDLSLRRPLQEINREFSLQIRAYDRGMEPRHTEATVVVRVISRSMPLFQQQYYSAAVPESIQPYSPVLSVHADSPEGRKLIYSIVAGNDHEEFAVDFNTEPDRKNNGPCVIYVVDQLDFETRQSYILTLQATDAVSGAHAEVLVSVSVEDVNDNAPEFAQTTYNVNVVETAPVGTVILELSTVDLDSGVNKLVQYTLRMEHGNASEYFHIHPMTGMVTVKSALDQEQVARHHFAVVASDSGVPALRSSTHVWVNVMDVNDNPPRFEQPTYHCFLSELATRGQFVTMVTAFDPDPTDQAKLTYTIVGGNDQQCFTINPSLGMITLVSLHKFNQQSAYTLNVSVSDGVYTSFTRVKVDILSSNRHAPQFERSRYEVHFEENQPTGTLVTKLYAVDEDRGSYGHVRYDIQSDTSKQAFTIDADTGEVHSKRILDRETQDMYEVPVVAVDDGGQSGYALLVVIVSDVNDNPPQFRLDEYRANIHANMSIGTTIVQVQATDNDYGLSAAVEYSIYETNASETNTTDTFGINRETGEIFLKRSALALENQVYQFFVRARDLGEPVLESEIPVDIFIIGPQDVPPKFSQRANQYFVHENAPIGTVITVLNARSNDTVSYSVVSQLDQIEGIEMFKVDDEGQMVVSGPLDRELQDVYTLTVRAETESSPPLTAFADITIQVMDENDNDPEFESNPYRVSVAENAAEGATVLKVVAHDRDLGHSSEVRYALGPRTEHLVNVFAIDSSTGWVTTLVPLDREVISHYSFTVVATDNGNPSRSATTMIQVKVQDYNDNPPRFTQDDFRAAVNEDALAGTVVIIVSTTDADEELNSRVEYYLTGGDPYGHFQIQHTGEIAVHKELDRENIPSYKLQVTATDGTYVSTANVYIEILDANDNPPVCKKVKYTKKVQESITVSSYILTVEASDRDEPHNARLKYMLTGEGSTHFTLDRSGGSLKVAKPLDREKRARYQLTAHVQDREYSNWECTSEVEIILSDVNDNAPEFTQDLYSVTVPEDTEIRTLVGKVHATDRDLGVNRKIKYSFVDSASGHFVIDDQSGLVSLAKALDREQRALFNLTIKATDQGVPQLSSLTHLLVVVLDINDNPPEFASRMYHASVPESSPPGSDVIRVLATSRDSGINAEITYSIVGGNEHGKFTIHPKTGVITIMQALDYERARDYYLTVQANDGGTPSLSNHATVNITITDANDNAPIFGQLAYSAIVQEDAQIGDRILQVVATDLDSPPNSRITYYVIKGDKLAQFGIHKQTGYITVESLLDRETIPNYQLEIQAMDSGIPNLSSTVLVNIEVSDANDNPPAFSTSNHTAFVQEDKPLGHNILKFVVTDADSPPNGGPFTFDIRAGNKGNEFHITHDGILRTATRFNHKIQEVYSLQVRVFDNGTPPLYSDTWVTVRVIEESRYQPVVAPLEVTVSSYLDEFPGGVLGQVKATDQDPYDRLSFALGSGYDHLFEIDADDGTLVALAGLDVGHYVLNISVSDGKFVTYGMVNVDVMMVTEQMLEHALVIRLDSITPEDFIVTYRRGFLRAMRNILSVRAKDVEILSIQPVPQVRRPKRQIQQDLDVMFAIQRGHAGFYLADHIRKALRDSRSTFESAMEVKLVKIHDNLCTADRCVRGDCRDRLVLDEKVVISITTETVSYVSPQHHHRVECICREGFGGERCDTPINECARDPCPPFMVCVADSSSRGYSCQCPEGKGGPVCKETCADSSCYEEKNPVSFRGKSYALYSLANSMDKQFALSLRFRTGQSTGCLKYAAGRVDYSILEIVNGVVQYRFNCGSGEGIVRVEHVHINDGKWHEVHLNRYGNKAELIVDSKSSSQGSTPGHNDILNIESNDIYFGAEVHPHPTISGYEDLRMGFVGCMDDIRIDHITLPLHVASGNSVAILRRFTNVEFQCILPPDLGMCGSQPCLNGGTCKANDNTYMCHCHNRFMGTRCEIDTNPCASNPCLHGGTCSNLHNDFHCSCSDGLSGKRCEFGRHCNPNPCRHGGVCEEGSHGPICKCRGFQGELCHIDIDECLRNPCTNGGNCLNTVGSFVCKCGPNATGPLCDNLIPSSSITSSSMNITVEEIIGIVATVLAIILLALIFVIVKKVRAKRARQRRHDALLDLPKDIIVKNKTHDDLKRCSKLSNLEAHTTVALMLPPRPASYTPSRHEDSGTALNNFDTVRSYGSAADDLESIPKYNADFLQNITKNNTASMPQGHPPPPPPTQASDSESLHKPSWDLDHNLKESYPETKIHNDLKSSRPSVQTPSHQKKKKTSLSSAHDAGRDAGNPSVSNFALDDSSAGSPQANSKGYHWDCSDWVRSQNPLPNITEVPTNEVPDSPSLHSNESNSHVDASTPPLDLDSEYVGDSEYNENEFELEEGKRPTPFDQLLALNNIDFADEGEAYSLPRHNYQLHPNQYLPTYSVTTDTETEENGNLLQIEDEPPPYSLHPKGGGELVPPTLDDMSVSLGGYTSTNASCSDLSENLCEIEDSEVCSEPEAEDHAKRPGRSGVKTVSTRV